VWFFGSSKFRFNLCSCHTQQWLCLFILSGGYTCGISWIYIQHKKINVLLTWAFNLQLQKYISLNISLLFFAEKGCKLKVVLLWQMSFILNFSFKSSNRSQQKIFILALTSLLLVYVMTTCFFSHFFRSVKLLLWFRSFSFLCGKRVNDHILEMRGIYRVLGNCKFFGFPSNIFTLYYSLLVKRAFKRQWTWTVCYALGQLFLGKNFRII